MLVNVDVGVFEVCDSLGPTVLRLSLLLAMPDVCPMNYSWRPESAAAIYSRGTDRVAITRGGDKKRRTMQRSKWEDEGTG